MHIFINTIVLG